MKPALAIIKKNLLSIICGVIAIAAIVAIFWPIDGYYSDLQQQADARKAAYTTATTLLHKPRTLPVLDPVNTDPVPLKVFPTEQVIARGKLAEDAIHTESQAMLDAATKLVTHTPLVQNALPAGGTMEATFFLRQYLATMTYPNPDHPDQEQTSLPVAILHAGTPPTAEAIKTQQDLVRQQIESAKTEKDATGNPINGPEVTAEAEAAVADVPDALKQDAASKNQMYIAPQAYTLEQLTNPPSQVAMFNAQIDLWLLQDVFTAMAQANQGTQGGVPNSVVKHLIKIEMPVDQFKPSYGGGGDQTAAPSADPLHPARVLTASPTGHVSNGLYDVVPFNLRIVVDAAQIPAVLDALSKNKFITVLYMDMQTVDSGQAMLAGFIYGSKPVVQLNLRCEELFFRADTLPYMPDAIKKALGVQPPPAPGAPAAP